MNLYKITIKHRQKNNVIGVATSDNTLCSKIINNFLQCNRINKKDAHVTTELVNEGYVCADTICNIDELMPF